METLIFILVGLVVLAFTVLSFYTSINGGAEKTLDWLRKFTNKKE
jgi:hypothetical protein